jgi:hypothetical protein
MTAIPFAPDRAVRSPSPAFDIQRYARLVGALMLLSIIFGYLGEMFIPGQFIVANDGAATAQRIVAGLSLYRFGFASYMVEAICDVSLSVLFYVLLKPVDKPLALTAAFFGLMGTALYAVAEAFYFAPTIWVGGAEFMRPFSPDQVNALTLLSLKVFSRIGWMFLAFYGIATFIRGYLIARSTYLPKFLGVLMMIGGAGFVVKNLTYVLVPKYSPDLLLAPLALAGLILMVWMLVKGVDVAKWQLQAAATRDHN